MPGLSRWRQLALIALVASGAFFVLPGRAWAQPSGPHGSADPHGSAERHGRHGSTEHHGRPGGAGGERHGRPGGGGGEQQVHAASLAGPDGAARSPAETAPSHGGGPRSERPGKHAERLAPPPPTRHAPSEQRHPPSPAPHAPAPHSPAPHAPPPHIPTPRSAGGPAALLTASVLPPYHLALEPGLPPAAHPRAVTVPAAAAPPEAAAVAPDKFPEPMVQSGGSWKGPSLRTAGGLTIPIAVGLAVGMFLIGQALVDRRDPKMARAPERSRNDTVGFG